MSLLSSGLELLTNIAARDEPKAVKSPLEEEDLIDLSDFDDTAPSKAM